MKRIINIEDYSYKLPQERIAKYPLDNRDESKLLVYRDGVITDDIFRNIEKYLPDETLLVRNNTKVIYARLPFRKKTGAKIEIFCLNPYEPAEYNLAFEAKGSCRWQCIVGNLKKWKDGVIELGYGNGKNLKATKIKREKDNVLVEFAWNSNESFSEVLEQAGNIPIPPYVNREAEEEDKIRYQTIYSCVDGSVAAPTAGLHFTSEVFDSLKRKRITVEEVTLHVGAGTFKPVKEKNAVEHKMHSEYIVVNKKAVTNVLKHRGKVIAVGTTSMRTLESLYWMGVKLVLKKDNPFVISQWEAYNLPQIDYDEAFEAILKFMSDSRQDYISAFTQIYIIPGYTFKVVDYLITNFHQPRSTLLLLVAAFVGSDWQKIYDYALANDFRFLSFGDSSLLFRS